MRISATLSLVVVLLTGAPVSAAQLFDFDGQATDASSVGQALTMVSRLVNASAVDLPLALDVTDQEYTIVVTGLVLDSSGSTDLFSGGTIAIYEDDGTASDWAMPSTFDDGTLVLSGDLVNLERTMFTSTVGTGVGSVNWTGGSRLGDLAPADRLGWPFLVNVSRAASQVEPGYDERWDGKVEPQSEVVAAELPSWSQVKARF